MRRLTDIANDAVLADLITQRSLKFYNGTYKWDHHGFEDEIGVYHAFGDGSNEQPPTPLPPTPWSDDGKVESLREDLVQTLEDVSTPCGLLDFPSVALHGEVEPAKSPFSDISGMSDVSDAPSELLDPKHHQVGKVHNQSKSSERIRPYDSGFNDIAYTEPDNTLVTTNPKDLSNSLVRLRRSTRGANKKAPAVHNENSFVSLPSHFDSDSGTKNPKKGKENQKMRKKTDKEESDWSDGYKAKVNNKKSNRVSGSVVKTPKKSSAARTTPSAKRGVATRIPKGKAKSGGKETIREKIQRKGTAPRRKSG